MYTITHNQQRQAAQPKSETKEKINIISKDKQYNPKSETKQNINITCKDRQHDPESETKEKQT